MKNWLSRILITVDLVFFVAVAYFLIPKLPILVMSIIYYSIHPIYYFNNFVDSFEYTHFKYYILSDCIIPLVLIVVGFLLFKVHKIIFQREEYSKIFLVFIWSVLIAFIFTELFYFIDFYQDEEPAGGLSKIMVIQFTLLHVAVLFLSILGTFYLYKKHKSILGK